MSDLTKFRGLDLSNLKDKLARPSRKIGIPSLQQRINQANQAKKEASFQVMPNRILLMLDISGSMNSVDYDTGHTDAKPKIEYLRNAVQGFAECLNSVDTSVCCVTIPWKENLVHPPSNEPAALILFNQRLSTTGSTPLGETMSKAISLFSVTRGIIISDGEKTDGETCFQQADNYKEAGIPLDCVHIGSSHEGESTLKAIALTTGGLYIKFTDVASFARGLKYLTPNLRPLLCTGSAAELIGATEIK